MDGHIKSFKELFVWQKCHEFVITTYRVTKKFPSDERFGLVNQMRRAAVSITSNIAEGFSRESYQEKVQFYAIAHGSLTELENQFIIARDTDMIGNKEYVNLSEKIDEAHKLLNRLLKSTKAFTKKT